MSIRHISGLLFGNSFIPDRIRDKNFTGYIPTDQDLLKDVYYVYGKELPGTKQVRVVVKHTIRNPERSSYKTIGHFLLNSDLERVDSLFITKNQGWSDKNNVECLVEGAKQGARLTLWPFAKLQLLEASLAKKISLDTTEKPPLSYARKLFPYNESRLHNFFKLRSNGGLN